MPTNLDLQVETFNAIQAAAQNGAKFDTKVGIVPIPGHPNRNYLVVGRDGSYEEWKLPLPSREASLHSVDQVGMFAVHALDRWNVRPSVYYSDEIVEIRLLDGLLDMQRGCAKVRLNTTRCWDLLSAWADTPSQAWLPHKEFIRTLRVTFGDCFENGSLKQLCESIGQLDFIQGERTQSVAIRNRESMGREVASEVKSLKGDIPEEVVLSVRVYRDPVLLRRHTIRCLLETDPQNGRLALIPLASQLDEAMDLEMGSLGDLLRASVRGPQLLNGPAADEAASPEPAAPQWTIPVFYGRP